MFIQTLKSTFYKLFKVDDTPQKTAFGFGLGVFLGIFPGTGPAAAFVLALFFRVNRAAAILGALLTNTWVSVATFLLAAKLGSVILRFNWAKSGVLETAVKLSVGYLIIGLASGLAAYLAVLMALSLRRRYYGFKRAGFEKKA